MRRLVVGTGIVLSVLFTVAVVAVLGTREAGQGESQDPNSGDLGAPEVRDLAERDCVLIADLDDPRATPARVPCATPGALRVYHVSELEPLADGSRPPEDELIARVDRRCAAAFERATGVPYLDADDDYYALYPTEATWERFDDRQLTCILVPAGR